MLESLFFGPQATDGGLAAAPEAAPGPRPLPPAEVDPPPAEAAKSQPTPVPSSTSTDPFQMPAPAAFMVWSAEKQKMVNLFADSDSDEEATDADDVIGLRGNSRSSSTGSRYEDSNEELEESMDGDFAVLERRERRDSSSSTGSMEEFFASSSDLGAGGGKGSGEGGGEDEEFASKSGTFMMFDPKTGKMVNLFEGEEASAAVLPDDAELKMLEQKRLGDRQGRGTSPQRAARWKLFKGRVSIEPLLSPIREISRLLTPSASPSTSPPSSPRESNMFRLFRRSPASSPRNSLDGAPPELTLPSRTFGGGGGGDDDDVPSSSVGGSSPREQRFLQAQRRLAAEGQTPSISTLHHLDAAPPPRTMPMSPLRPSSASSRFGGFGGFGFGRAAPTQSAAPAPAPKPRPTRALSEIVPGTSGGGGIGGAGDGGGGGGVGGIASKLSPRTGVAPSAAYRPPTERTAYSPLVDSPAIAAPVPRPAHKRPSPAPQTRRATTGGWISYAEQMLTPSQLNLWRP